MEKGIEKEGGGGGLDNTALSSGSHFLQENFMGAFMTPPTWGEGGEPHNGNLNYKNQWASSPEETKKKSM